MRIPANRDPRRKTAASHAARLHRGVVIAARLIVATILLLADCVVPRWKKDDQAERVETERKRRKENRRLGASVPGIG